MKSHGMTRKSTEEKMSEPQMAQMNADFSHGMTRNDTEKECG